MRTVKIAIAADAYILTGEQLAEIRAAQARGDAMEVVHGPAAPATGEADAALLADVARGEAVALAAQTAMTANPDLDFRTACLEAEAAAESVH